MRALQSLRSEQRGQWPGEQVFCPMCVQALDTCRRAMDARCLMAAQACAACEAQDSCKAGCRWGGVSSALWPGRLFQRRQWRGCRWWR